MESVSSMTSGEEDAEEEEDDEFEDEDEDADDDDLESGMESVSSMTSGTDTPETLQLRKKDNTSETGSESSDAKPKSLYTVLEQKPAPIGANQIFGTSHTYVMPKESEQEKRIAAKQAKQKGEINIALNPEELESLDAMTLKRKYEAQLEAEAVAKHPVVREEEDESSLKKRKVQKTDKKKFKYKF